MRNYKFYGGNMNKQGLTRHAALIGSNNSNIHLFSKNKYNYMARISKQELERQYVINKKTTTEISRLFNCSPSLITYYLKKYLIPMRPYKDDITGQKFGKLTVLNYIGTKKGESKWYCMCDCGKATEASLINLRRGGIKSCGCLKSEIKKTHGLSDSRQYHIWQGMKTRCSNPNAIKYDQYGGAGITYDERWESFEAFWNDMGKTYQDGLTLERIDSTLGYTKENCKWANYSEQNRHRKRWAKPVIV
jgi:hypothetical protein